jgi:hypothetical protein
MQNQMMVDVICAEVFSWEEYRRSWTHACRQAVGSRQWNWMVDRPVSVYVRAEDAQGCTERPRAGCSLIKPWKGSASTAKFDSLCPHPHARKQGMRPHLHRHSSAHAHHAAIVRGNEPI